MTTFGVSMCKDEADVIAGTLTHLADEVDHLIVADNGSTDGTREILAELEDSLPLTVLEDPEVGYYQSEKMTALASAAADQGATWIVPFDADELWVWRGKRIRDELAELHGVDVVTAPVFDHRPSGIDPKGDDPFDTIQWRETRAVPLPKVAFRWRPGVVIHQGNHGVTLQGGSVRRGLGLEVRHFPWRTAEQFVRKARNGAAAYAATDLGPDIGAHWRGYGEILERFGADALVSDVFAKWFWHLSPADAGLVLDPAPYMRWRRP